MFQNRMVRLSSIARGGRETCDSITPITESFS